MGVYATGFNPIILNCTLYGNTGNWGNGSSDKTVLNNCLLVGNTDYGSDGKEVYASNSVFTVSESNVKIKGGAGNRFNAGGATKNFFSSAVDDFRLMPSSLAVFAGDFDEYDRLTLDMGIPERHRLLDWCGNPIVASKDRKIHSGAVQCVVGEDEAQSGVLQLGPNVGVVGFGQAENTNQWTIVNENVYQSVRTTNWPAQVCLDHFKDRFGRGGRLLYYKDKPGYRYFGNVTNDQCWVTLPPRGETNTISAQLASCIYYADAEKPNDLGDGLTPQTAKRTIQAAVETARAVGDFALVLVAAGTYRDGGAEDGASGRSRVLIAEKSAMVRSLEGPDRTFICGEADPDTQGIGPQARRCVATSCAGWFHGFTLTGGWTMNDANKGLGGAFFGNGDSDTRSRAIIDCIVTNNHARNNAAIWMGQADRCYFADNHNEVAGMASYSIFNNVLLTSCTVNRQADDLGLLLRNLRAHNCTIVGGDGTKTMSYDGNLKAYNTIFAGCGALAQLSDGSAVSGCVLYGTTIPPEGVSSSRTLDPVFADVSAGDFRPYSGLGIIGSGDSLSPVEPLRWRFCGGDMLGGPMVFAGSRSTPGAVQRFHDEAVCISRLSSMVAVEGGAREGWNSLAGGRQYQLTALDQTRPFRGFQVDGEYLVPRTYSLVLDGTFAGKTVAPVYTSEWYVDAVGGNDKYDGMTPQTAKQTLQGVMTTAVVSGDTVHAAAGDYASGEMFYEGHVLPSRVVIAGGVTLVADEGAAATRIVGSAATDCAPGLQGLGKGAVRCVALCEGARIENFTVVHGHTLLDVASEADGVGGGIWSPKTSRDTVAYGCVITGNCALSGGGTYKVNSCNCVFTGNLAKNYGSMIDQGYAFGCFFNNSRCNVSVINGYREIYGCTFGADLLNADGSVKTTIGPPNEKNESLAWCSKFANNVVMIPHAVDATQVQVYNSVILDSAKIDKGRCHDCAFPASLNDFGLDAGFAPVAGGASPALARADTTKVSDLCRGVDVRGLPRMSNGAVDAGAFQSDWRRRYTQDVKASWRRLPCVFASGQVHEVPETRTVRLEDGEISFVRGLEAVKDEKLAISAVFDLQATGKLQVFVDEVLVREYAAPGETVTDSLMLPAALGATVRFAYVKGADDGGSAELSLCRLPAVGFRMICR
jgi:hypothetical protein